MSNKTDPNRKLRTERNRREIIKILGNKCVHCGEDTYELLTLDHINNDGYLDRKLNKINHETELLKFLKAGNKSKKYQVMCYNCNCSKGVWGIPMTPIKVAPWEML